MSGKSSRKHDQEHRLGIPEKMLSVARLADSSVPLLLLVVDTEEEFDWSLPFSRTSRGVSWIRGFPSAHAAFVDAGLRPTYVVNYPVASTGSSAEALARASQGGCAEIGAHLHPWVTPPETEAVNAFNSYGGNLAPDLEFDKLHALCDSIIANIGVKPVTFKAGRYGVAARTPLMLAQLGFKVDLSTTPGFDWSGDGGPDHSWSSNLTQWIATDPALLEIPTTGGWFGPLRAIGKHMLPAENEVRSGSVVRWALRNARLLQRAMLTPEGYSLRELQGLTDCLFKDGVRVFSLSFHSPSLFPGNTPFVRSEEELRAFIDLIVGFARWFERRYRGRFVTASEARDLHLPPAVTPLTR